MTLITTTAVNLTAIASAKTVLLAAGARSNNNPAQRAALTAAANALDQVTMRLDVKKGCGED